MAGQVGLHSRIGWDNAPDGVVACMFSKTAVCTQRLLPPFILFTLCCIQSSTPLSMLPDVGSLITTRTFLVMVSLHATNNQLVLVGTDFDKPHTYMLSLSLQSSRCFGLSGVDSMYLLLQSLSSSGKEGPRCESEDCLNVNVFCPAEGDNHVVMLWIHGGM